MADREGGGVMPYAQLDDRYDDHRKTKRAWRMHPAAVGLHAMAITYCSRHNTDGLLHADWLDEKLELSPLKPRERQAVLNALLDTGLFEVEGDDYRVHDYLQWNRSRAQREALAKQGRRGGQAKAVAKAKPPLDDGSGPGQAKAKPSPSEGSSTSLQRQCNDTARHDTKPSAKAEDDDIARLCDRLATLVVSNDPKANPSPGSSRWLTDMRLLLADRNGDAGEVERIIDWCQSDSFWRSNILSPGKLRKQFTQLLLKAESNVRPLRRENASDWLRDINPGGVA